MATESDHPAVAPRTAVELLALMEKSQPLRRAYVLACLALDKAAHHEMIKAFADFTAEERVDLRLLTRPEVAQAITKYCVENPINCRYFRLHG